MTVAIPEVSREQLDKYGGPAPRYTSYPTALDWRDDVRPTAYPGMLHLATRSDDPLSLYVHIPFCERRCLFCGCNVAVTRDRSRGDVFMSGIERELETLRQSGIGRRPLSQVHWGGGTPTWLTEGQTVRLHDAIRATFGIVQGAEVAIEVDPRVTTGERVRLLAGLGFDRISMGVQDLDAAVQKEIGRIQHEDATQELLDLARSVGFKSVNIDLIQGLPGQTVDSFSETVRRIVSWRPDRIALFRYAHVPWLQKHHTAIDLARVPTAREKVDILRQAVTELQAAGYVFLGLDHFALEEDELAVAAREGRLSRNFMGYTARAGGDLLGVGPSAIGEVEGAYVQSSRDVNDWRAAVDERGYSVARGHRLTHDDRVRRRVIMELMCNGRVRKTEIEARYGIAFDTEFEREIAALKSFDTDGLLELRPHGFAVTPLGRLFVRQVAAVFDRFRWDRSGQDERFSLTV